MEIRYNQAAPLRTTAVLAWLIEYEAGGRDLMLTSADMPVERVVEMVGQHTHDEFKVRNVTVGAFPLWTDGQMKEVPEHLQGFYMVYFNDARAVDRDGMVQL